MGKNDRIPPSTGNANATQKRQRNRRQTVKWLTKEQVVRFFQAIPAENIRDRLLFRLMYFYGLRRGEAARLTLDRIRGDRIRPPRLKGGDDTKWYRMLPNTLALLRCYLKIRGDDPCPYLFRGKRKKCAPLAGSTMAWLFRRYAIAADLPRDLQHCHALRHSIGRHMAEEGMDISDAQDHLAHVNIKTTQIYFQISERRREKNYRRMRRSREIVHL